MESGLQFQNPFVLDLLGELKRCFVFEDCEIIRWWIEIQLQVIISLSLTHLFR